MNIKKIAYTIIETIIYIVFWGPVIIMILGIIMPVLFCRSDHIFWQVVMNSKISDNIFLAAYHSILKFIGYRFMGL